MHRTRPCAGQSRDGGFALITVLGAMTVVTLFLLSSLAYALNNTAPSRKDQDAKAALAAAQAGIAEFASRLALDDSYHANDGGIHSSNPAFAREVAVQGTAGAGAVYRYQLLTTAQETGVNGMVRLAVTGCSRPSPVLPTDSNPEPCRGARGVERELVAEYRPDGFLKYIYFTDYESGDPSVVMGGTRIGVGNPPVYSTTEPDTSTGSPHDDFLITYRSDPVTQADICRTHHHSGRHARSFTAGNYIEVRQRRFRGEPTGTPTEITRTATVTAPMTFSSAPCYEIRFTGNDEVSGLAHSNDSFGIVGPARFTSTTTSAWGPVGTGPTVKAGMTAIPPPTDGRLWWGDPKHLTLPDKLPEHGPPIPLPDSNAALKKQADPALAGPGCLYTGQTRVTFMPDPDGAGPLTAHMRVLSPATTSTNAPSTPVRCYNTATPGVEQTIAPIPPVIYVQDGACGPTNNIGFPHPDEVTDGPASYTTRYACGNGHAFVSGVLSGRVTIGTQRDVVITGDTTYRNGVTGTDALGLIPEGSAWIYHPVTRNTACAPTEWCHWVNVPSVTPVRRVDAAILSVGNSFLVQNWYLGQPLSSESAETACLPQNLDTMTGCSKLTVRGSIIQRFRGPVGEAATTTAPIRPRSGYLKNYVYDERLRNAPPPYFLRPRDSWRLHQVTD